MMMFMKREVGFSRLRRAHLPKQRLSGLIRTGRQGYGLAGGRAMHSSTFYGLGIAANERRQNGDLWLDIRAGTQV